MTDHPDLEALSASLDGEEAMRHHLNGCATCRAARARLEAARDAVAQPILPLSDVLREQAIASALAAADEWQRPGGEAPAGETSGPAGPPGTPVAPVAPVAIPAGRRRPRQWWLGGAAAAAVVAAVVGMGALLNQQSTDDGTNTALGGEAPTAERAVGDASDGGPGLGPSGQTATGLAPTAGGIPDLGEVASVEALRSRLAAVAAGTGQSVAAPSGAAGPAAVSGSAASATSSGASGPPLAAREVGTRVCEAEARAVRPQLGSVTLSATLHYQGTPAVVLQFSPTPSDPVVRLLVLAPGQGCRLLAETTVS